MGWSDKIERKWKAQMVKWKQSRSWIDSGKERTRYKTCWVPRYVGKTPISGKSTDNLIMMFTFPKYFSNENENHLNFQFDLFFCLKVERRYSDFAAMYELLVLRYRCRLIPKLPPKNIGSMIVGVKSGLVGERRRALKRWLLILLNHPIVSLDPVVQVPYIVLSK